MQEVTLKKHSALTQVAGGPATLIEKKIHLTLLYKASKNEKKDGMYYISYQELRKTLDINVNTIKIKQALKTLQSTIVTGNLLGKMNKQEEAGYLYSQIQLLGEIDYFTEGFNYNFPKKIEDLLKDPKIFVLLNMTNIKKLTNIHAITLYELISDYKKIGRTPLIPLDVLRELFNVQDKYPEYKELNRSVISKAMENINAETEYKVDITTSKKESITVAVQFLIEIKHEKLIQKGLDDNAQVFEITAIGTKPKTSDRKHEIPEDVLEAIDRLSKGKNQGYKAVLIRNYEKNDNATLINIEEMIDQISKEKEHRAGQKKLRDACDYMRENIGSKVVANNGYVLSITDAELKFDEEYKYTGIRVTFVKIDSKESIHHLFTLNDIDGLLIAVKNSKGQYAT